MTSRRATRSAREGEQVDGRAGAGSLESREAMSEVSEEEWKGGWPVKHSNMTQPSDHKSEAKERGEEAPGSVPAVEWC